MGLSRSVHISPTKQQDDSTSDVGCGAGGAAWVDDLQSVLQEVKEPMGGRSTDAGYSEAVEPVSPQYASVDEVTGTTSGSLVTFIKSLGLPNVCMTLAEEAGIDVPDDFYLFSESELVSNHGFKVGHVRKIFKKLGN